MLPSISLQYLTGFISLKITYSIKIIGDYIRPIIYTDAYISNLDHSKSTADYVIMIHYEQSFIIFISKAISYYL
jgi:hypothetical protein